MNSFTSLTNRVVLALASIALVAGATASPMPTQAQAEPYEINAVMPLTGSAAFLGQTLLQGLKLVEKQTNATGGIHGRPLKFVIADDQSSPQIDVQLMGPLIAKHVPVIIDGGPVAMCRASMPLVTNGPVLYCLSPALYPPAGSYAFSTSGSSEDETRALVNFMRSKNWKRVGVITPTDATGQEFERVIHTLMALPENRGMELVSFEHFAPSDISIAAQVAKVKDSKPDVVMAWGTGTATATEYRGLKDAGVDVPVVGANGNQSYAAMEQWASILPRQYYQYAMKWPLYKQLRPGPIKSAMETMYKAYAAEGARPDIGASGTWDPASIIVAQLRALPEGATATQLRDSIETLHGYAGINGFYDFRIGNQRGLGVNDCIVVRWNAATKTFEPVSGSARNPLQV
jgi:branched-chain amino acid transport system substrate-binding protein